MEIEVKQPSPVFVLTLSEDEMDVVTIALADLVSDCDRNGAPDWMGCARDMHDRLARLILADDACCSK